MAYLQNDYRIHAQCTEHNGLVYHYSDQEYQERISSDHHAQLNLLVQS